MGSEGIGYLIKVEVTGKYGLDVGMEGKDRFGRRRGGKGKGGGYSMGEKGESQGEVADTNDELQKLKK